tara:strand:+ start:6091 stop:6834 length:744 start_codon:yes stop_codon:yes gene_type:complete
MELNVQNTIFIFDVDGTLTDSRTMMHKFMQDTLQSFIMNKNRFYLVTGSDLAKTKTQVPEDLLNQAEGVFCCAGNNYYKRGELIYENKFDAPSKLIKFLEKKVKNSKCPVKAGRHIEERGSMVNFSVIGRACTLEERKAYGAFDGPSKERELIAKEIKETFPDLDATLGGQISIDIYPKGMDKSQVIQHIETECPNKRYIFLGDRMHEGGNDYPLAKKLDEMEFGTAVPVRHWTKTIDYITMEKFKL